MVLSRTPRGLGAALRGRGSGGDSRRHDLPVFHTHSGASAVYRPLEGGARPTLNRF